MLLNRRVLWGGDVLGDEVGDASEVWMSVVLCGNDDWENEVGVSVVCSEVFLRGGGIWDESKEMVICEGGDWKSREMTIQVRGWGPRILIWLVICGDFEELICWSVYGKIISSKRTSQEIKSLPICTDKHL